MNHSFTYPMLYLFQFFIHYGSHNEVKDKQIAVFAECVMLLPEALPWPSQNGGRNQIQNVSSERWALSSRILKKLHSKCFFTQSLIEY